MNILRIIIFLLGITSQASHAQLGVEMLHKYQAAIVSINTIGYDVQRIDTFPSGSVWNNSGRAVIQRNHKSKILSANFSAFRLDLGESYYYNGNIGFALDDKARTFQMDITPYTPSILGSPAGQMLIEELLAIDSSYQTVTYTTSAEGEGILHLRYADQPNIDVLDRHTYLLFKGASILPHVVKTTMLRGGGKWTTVKTVSNMRINSSLDSESLSNQSFLATYTPYILAEPKQATVNSSLLGHPAPNFRLSSFTGTSVNLSDYRGKTLLLDFWQTSCSPCIAAIPYIQKMQSQYQGEGFIVLSILMDSDAVERAQGILRRQHATYINLIGNKKVKSEYYITSFPRYIVVDKNGKVTLDQSGGGNMEKVTAAVKKALGQ